MLILLKVGGEC